MSISIEVLSLFVGFLSAVSLPLGSWVGLISHPRARVTSMLMAFGGGALLFALTIEIIAGSFYSTGFLPVALGCIIGGVFYEILNHGFNSLGAFLRKVATAVGYLTVQKRKEAEHILKVLSKVLIFQSMSSDQVVALIPTIEQKTLNENEVIFTEGSPADSFYVIDKGKVQIIKDGKVIAEGGSGVTFGEMALITDSPRVATAIAREKSIIFSISKSYFNKLIQANSSVKKAIEESIIERESNLVKSSSVSKTTAKKWREKSLSCLKSKEFLPSLGDIEAASEKYGNASMGIWLGILLDGIPESFVIGVSVMQIKSVPWAFIAAVFLANFPEAMSSSVNMRRQDYSKAKIIFMWSSIAVITGLGAFIGSVVEDRKVVDFIC